MKTFGFNLLPSKPKALVVKEEKRDNYSVYTAFLPLMGAIVWISLVVFNGLVIDKHKQDWITQVEAHKASIAVQYTGTQVVHGELVVKTNTLAGVIQKDIQPEQLFNLTDELFPQADPTFTIKGYGRETDGSFNVTVDAVSYQRLAEVARRFSDYEKITKVSIKTAQLDPKKNEINGVISFFFINNSNATSTSGTNAQ